MSDDRLSRLRSLRLLREQRAQSVLAAANRVVLRTYEDLKNAEAEAERAEADAEAADRRQLAEVLAQVSTGPLLLARLGLRHKIGVDTIRTALRRVVEENGRLAEAEAEAEIARSAWAGTAKSVRKIEYMIERRGVHERAAGIFASRGGTGQD